jgi:hypothetical protein
MMRAICRLSLLCLLLFAVMLCGEYPASAQNSSPTSQTPTSQAPLSQKMKKQPAPELTLTNAIICEYVRGYKPYNQTIAVSTSIGKAICYTSFDPVPERTVIYHHWYRFDVMSTSIKLELQPPSWATYSTFQLREADKGPWRVEVTDKDGSVFSILRFSITD